MNSSQGVKTNVGKNKKKRNRRKKKSGGIKAQDVEVIDEKMKSIGVADDEVEDEFHPNNEPCRHYLDAYLRERQKIKLPKSNPDNSPVIYGEFPYPVGEEAYQQWLADGNKREELEKELKKYYEADDDNIEELEKELKKKGKMYGEKLEKELKNKYDEELEKELKKKHDE